MKKQYTDFLLRLSFLVATFILSGIAINAYSQVRVEPAATPCDIEIQCLLDTVSNYSIQMTTMPYSGPYPDPPQGGCGMDNPHWYAFVAGHSILTVTIQVKNCTQGSSGPGVQFTIYQGDPTCNIINDTLTVAGLEFLSGQCKPSMAMGTYAYVFRATPGHTYYFLLDGYANSLCEVSINIQQERVLPPLDQASEVFIEPLEDSYCAGDIIEITSSHDTGGFYTNGWDDYLTDNGDGTASFLIGENMDFVHFYYTYADTSLGCLITADYIIENIIPLPILYHDEVSIDSGDSATIGVEPEENVVYTWSTGETGSYITVTEGGDYTISAIDTISGCENSIVINVTVVVSVISIEETKLNLYPNPFKDMLTIESLDYNGGFKLMNTQSVIYTDGMFRQGETLRINSSSWPPGTYYMILEDSRSVKLMKQ